MPLPQAPSFYRKYVFFVLPHFCSANKMVSAKPCKFSLNKSIDFAKRCNASRVHESQFYQRQHLFCYFIIGFEAPRIITSEPPEQVSFTARNRSP
jgi:hypothetical protein